MVFMRRRAKPEAPQVDIFVPRYVVILLVFLVCTDLGVNLLRYSQDKGGRVSPVAAPPSVNSSDLDLPHGVAVLLSGEPRTYTTTLNNLVRDVISPLRPDVYVFCSGDDVVACDEYERALQTVLGKRLLAFDSLERMRARVSRGGIATRPGDVLALSYLTSREALRERMGMSIKLFQGTQFVMLRFAWELALKGEAARNAPYHTVLRLRPDVLLLSPLPLAALRLRRGGWVYAINDWLVIGRRDAMLPVAMLADKYGLVGLPPGFSPGAIPVRDGVPLCGESQLMARLLSEGIRYYPLSALGVTAGIVVSDTTPDLNDAVPQWRQIDAAAYLSGGAAPRGAQFAHDYLIRGWLAPDEKHAFLYETAPPEDAADPPGAASIVYREDSDKY